LSASGGFLSNGLSGINTTFVLNASAFTFTNGILTSII
jgi:hypothetical protein